MQPMERMAIAVESPSVSNAAVDGPLASTFTFAASGKRWLKWFAAIAAIAAASAGAFRLSKSRPAPTVRYQSAAIDHGPLTARVTASGAVSAIVTVQVGSQVSGRIQRLNVDFNSTVKAGELIATIEPSFFRAAEALARANEAAARAGLHKAAANRTLAERTFVRGTALLAKKLVAQADVDADEAQLLSSRADVEAAQASLLQAQAARVQADLNLSYTNIVSPIDGVVVSRTVDVGQTVAASFQAPTLFTIAQDLTKMQVDTNVAEGDVGRLHEGMEATFTVDAYPNRTFRGKVRQIRDNATTLQNVVTYDAVINVDNSDLALRPSMTANASFVYARRDDVIRIPAAALRFKPDVAMVALLSHGAQVPSLSGGSDERLVWVLANGVTVPRVVHVGIGDGMLSEVVAGDLRAGSQVVTEATPTAAANGEANR